MALGECKTFIQQNNLEPIDYFDTAGAARWLAETQQEGASAIAGELAAKYYNLEIARRGVGNYPTSQTRFLVISSKPGKEGGNKTSISFTTKNESGALAKIMDLFAQKNINLSHVDSILQKNGNYLFFVDVEANINDPETAKLFEQIQDLCVSYRMLGCYEEISPKTKKDE